MKKSLMFLVLLFGVLAGLQAQERTKSVQTVQNSARYTDKSSVNRVASKTAVLTENFDGETFPAAGWSAPVGTGTADANYTGQIRWYGSSEYFPGQGEPGGYEPGRGGAGHSAVLQSYWFKEGAACDLISPAMDLSTQSNLEVSFYFMNGTDTNNDKVQIFVQDGEANPVQLGADVTGTLTTWLKISRSLNDYCGAGHTAVKVIIKGTSDFGMSNMAIDDFAVDAAPTSPVFSILPAAIASSMTLVGLSSGLTAATITNSGSGSLVISSRNDIKLEGTDAADFVLVDSLTFPVTLAASQSAKFYVKFMPLSAGTKTASVSVTTQGDKGVHANCIALSGSAYVPYTTSNGGFTESFDTYNGANGPYYNGWFLQWGTSAVAFHSGTQSIWLSSGSKSKFAISPRMTIVDKDSIEMWIQRNAAVTADTIKVAYTEDLDIFSASFTNLAAYYLADTPTEFTSVDSRKRVDLSSLAGKSIYVAFIGSSVGSSTRMDDVRFFNNGTAIADDKTPSAAALAQNYPNPFNPETTINFALANQSKVALTVYNAKGEMVTELVNEVRTAGNHSVKFNAAGMNSGVYFYKLTTPETSMTQKMLLVK